KSQPILETSMFPGFNSDMSRLPTLTSSALCLKPKSAIVCLTIERNLKIFPEKPEEGFIHFIIESPSSRSIETIPGGDRVLKEELLDLNNISDTTFFETVSHEVVEKVW